MTSLDTIGANPRAALMVVWELCRHLTAKLRALIRDEACGNKVGVLAGWRLLATPS